MNKESVKFIKTLSSLFVLIALLGCSSDDSITDDDSDDGSTTGTIDTDSYIVVVDTGFDSVYLINHDGDELFEWDLEGDELGDDAQLLDDGSLIVSLQSSNSNITFGGYGGKFRKINADQTTDWEVTYSSNTYRAHHDVDYLSNGNIIFLVWEEVSAIDAEEMGFAANNDMYPESIIELNPSTNEVVWEWHATDHFIQDHDSTKSNYGVVVNNPNKIDVNYNSSQSDGDIMHANGITIDETNDLLYVTVNYYSEVWVIDHSTTTAEAASDSGGNYDLGGDLVYRFGNPLTYDNVGDVTLNRVHYPNLFDANSMLVFSNNIYNGQSAVIEYELSPPYQLIAGQDNEPTVTWEFTDSSLYSLTTSSASRMSNGNTLIGEGTAGTIWEVSESGEVLWKNTNYNSIWRTYPYEIDSPAITALGL
ncbi:arylsulfotransferase family protein [Winogradskyella psychrotolerans]|uniref:arylsulfotransferase family protein n=1 Tax=Winogradskyella psychrotolerans TaxID=1344585 RepID=UPI001C070F73|nr:arylsulfotransferase family protein [Winogradskyella psychrotolerans]MBU2929680.1 aryl-sulfate sulfotransferase [Winogradskyella psychrotolerans]